MPTGLDLDGNGYLGDARDAQGYGRFSGDGGIAILSRLPLDAGGVVDRSALLWKDLPEATLPMVDGKRFPSDAAIAIQRLSTSAHWAIPVLPIDAAPFTLLTYSATPPVFDGPEDRNGLRNRDELALMQAMLENTTGAFVVTGNTNLDPSDGQGFSDAMAAFLTHPRLNDPRPQSAGGKAAADANHSGDPSLDTADWPDNVPGNLRVTYVLPSTDWQQLGSGVFWPAPGDPDAALLGDDGLLTGPHRLVWVDIARN